MRLGISGFITDILSTSSNICFCWADGKPLSLVTLLEHTASTDKHYINGWLMAINRLLFALGQSDSAQLQMSLTPCSSIKLTVPSGHRLGFEA
ncbi:hypothetical protein AOLI_G00074830 [Acnodon oligacanthus]